MKKTFALCLVATTGLFLAHCSSDEKSGKEEQKEVYTSATQSADSLCLVTPSWFPHSQTPPPAEGKGSPFDVSSTTNQIFHQWSWNKFLWLTKPVNGNPLFLDPTQVMQVTSFMIPVKPQPNAMVVLTDSLQAGSSSPMLQTNAAYGSKSQMVYYSIHMNPLMYKAGVNYAIQLARKTLPETNGASFPVGSFEMKVAWVPVAAIAASKLANYYTTTAALSTNGGKTYTNINVALIGMHVVGIVENHPEFIWATFEHDDLSPDYDWKANSASATDDMLLFKKGSVSGINGITFNTSTKLGNQPYQVFDLFQYGVPRNNTGGFMDSTSQSEPVNFDNVDGINKCVKGQLNDVWNNYFYNGSIWLNMDGTTPAQQAHIIDSLGFGIGSATYGSYARGSLNCANVTMESFTQTFESDINSINVTNLANCFSCHGGVQFSSDSTSPLYLSHTFQGFLNLKKGKSVNDIENMKTKYETRIMSMLKK